MSSSGSPLVARLVLTGDNKGIVASAEGTVAALDHVKRKAVETGAAAAGMSAEFNANAIALKGQAEAATMANAAIAAGAETKRADIVALTQQASAGEAVTNRIRAMSAAHAEYNAVVAQSRALLASETITQAEYGAAVQAASAKLALARASADAGTAAMITEQEAAIAIGAALGGLSLEADKGSMALDRLEANLAKLGRAGGVGRGVISRVRAGLAAIPEVISAFPLVSGAAAATAAVGVAIAAEQSYEASIGRVNIALQAHGLAIAGQSETYLKLASDIAAASNVSTRSAREMEASFADAHIDPQLWGKVSAMSKDYAAVLGVSVPEAAQKAAEGLAKPYEWAVQLTEQYGLFDQAVLQHIRDLTESGHVMEAQSAITDAWAARIKNAAEQTGGWALAWRDASKGVSDFWDSVGKAIFPGADPKAQLANYKRELADAKKGVGVLTLDNTNTGLTHYAAPRSIDAILADIKRVNDAIAKTDPEAEARNREQHALSEVVNSYKVSDPFDQQLRTIKQKKKEIETFYGKGGVLLDDDGKQMSKEQALAAADAKATELSKQRAAAVRALNDAEKQHYDKIKQLISGSEEVIAQSRLEANSATGRIEAYRQGAVALDAFNDQQQIAKTVLPYVTELSWAQNHNMIKQAGELEVAIAKLTAEERKKLAADKELAAMQDIDQGIAGSSGYMSSAVADAALEINKKNLDDWGLMRASALDMDAKDWADNQHKLELLMGQKQKTLLDEDLRNRHDWASGIKRANQEVLQSYSDFASQSEGFIKGWAQQGEDAVVSFAKTGKVNIGSLASFVEDQFLKMAYQRYLGPSMNSAGNSVLGFVDQALSSLGSMFSVSAGVHHGGGRAGSAAGTRDVPVALYYAAPRYHRGIDKVLKQGEHAAILQDGERVQTQVQANSTDTMIAAFQQLQSRPVVNVLPQQAVGPANGMQGIKFEFHNHGEPMEVANQNYDPQSNTMRVDVKRSLDKAVAASIHSGAADTALKRYGATPVLKRRQ